MNMFHRTTDRIVILLYLVVHIVSSGMERKFKNMSWSV